MSQEHSNDRRPLEKPHVLQVTDELQSARQLIDAGAFEELNETTHPILSLNGKLFANMQMDAIGNRIKTLDRQRHAVPERSSGITEEIDLLTHAYLKIRELHYPETGEHHQAPLWVSDQDQNQLRFATSNGCPELITEENFAWLAMLGDEARIGYLLDAYNSKIAMWQTRYSQMTSMQGLPGMIVDDTLLKPIKDILEHARIERDALIVSLQSITLEPPHRILTVITQEI